MTNIIFAAMLWLLPGPSPKWNETRDEFKARLEMNAMAVSEATRGDRELALAVAVTYWGESRFSPLVQSGERRGDGGLAICLGGLHQLKMTAEEWLALAGTSYESMVRCASETARRLRSAMRYCQARDPKAGWTEAFTLYGTGRTCRPEETKWQNIFLDRGKKHAALMARS